MSDFFTLTLHPTPANTYHKEPKRTAGFLTEKDAWDYHHRNYLSPTYWGNAEVVPEPLSDPRNPDQLYVVVSPEGHLETGHHSSAVPKLYLLPWARQVANKNSRYNASDKRAPWRVLPVTLSYGAPV